MNELELKPGESIESLPASQADTLIGQAIASGLPAESLERLIAMRNDEADRLARLSYFQAFAQFQSECPVIIANKAADRYDFAPLGDIVAQVAPILAKHGLTYRWKTHAHESGGLTTQCIVTHQAGHSETTECYMPATKGQGTNISQDQGIISTYGRRYSLTGALGIATADKDMDGRLPEPEPDPTPITKEQAADLRDLYEAAGGEQESGFCQFLGHVDTFDELPARVHGRAVQAIKAKMRADV